MKRDESLKNKLPRYHPHFRLVSGHSFALFRWQTVTAYADKFLQPCRSEVKFGNLILQTVFSACDTDSLLCVTFRRLLCFFTALYSN